MKEKVMQHPSGLVLPIELARRIQREGVSAIPDEVLLRMHARAGDRAAGSGRLSPESPYFQKLKGTQQMRYRNDDPPEESYPPDEKITRVTLSAELRGDTWSIACPQWNCEIPDKSLTRGTALIFSEIEKHNEEIERDEKQLPAEPHYSVVPKDKRRHCHCDWRDFPAPDNGTMTPNRDIWNM